MRALQTTLAGETELAGIGIHTGAPARFVLKPARAGTGIVFRLAGPDGTEKVPAKAAGVLSTALSTVLGRADGPKVATVEHVLAALSGLGVDNAIIDVEGPEAPVLDGSAAQIIAAVDAVGIKVLSARRRAIRVLKPVRIEANGGFAELLPYDGRRLDVTIDFAEPAIGRQTFAAELTPSLFRREIAAARTFGRMSDAAALKAAGYGRGASLENTIAVDGDKVLNPDGLRWPDEFVRHKALDAIGDLALAGLPIVGCYRSYRGGHSLNVATVQALLADSRAHAVVALAPEQVAVSGAMPAPALASARG